MTDSTKKTTGRPRKRRRTVSIGGTSQSAFAGYAVKTGDKTPKKKVTTKSEATNEGSDPGASGDK